MTITAPVTPRKYSPDTDPATIAVFETVEPYTMTGIARIAALRNAVQYISRNGISGDVVECGVWKGGSMMATALTLLELDDTARHLHLFDTFEGMPEPSHLDKDTLGGDARTMYHDIAKEGDGKWCCAGVDEVRDAMALTHYPPSQIHYIQGKVEQTLPSRAPDKIALLRLDTDWYESTYHELIHLYTRLSVGGVLIIDDYGHWQGARKAVDQFIAENRLKLLLNRVDYTARIAVKLEA